MSDIKIQPSATGSGTVTITAPTTNTARVITLPDSAGTLLDENSSVPSANLTGDLPAISGASLTGLTSAQMPAGSVLQVKIVEDTSLLLVATASYTDTNMSVSITPTSTSSKILAVWTVQGNLSVANAGWGVKLLRDSTAIWTSAVQYIQYTADSNGARDTSTHMHLDSPNTTSAITYKVQVSSYSSRNIYFNDDNAQSQLVVMEIAG